SPGCAPKDAARGVRIPLGSRSAPSGRPLFQETKGTSGKRRRRASPMADRQTSRDRSTEPFWRPAELRLRARHDRPKTRANPFPATAYDETRAPPRAVVEHAKPSDSRMNRNTAAPAGVAPGNMCKTSLASRVNAISELQTYERRGPLVP